MKTERLEISDNQKQQIITMIQGQGISQSEIDQIINGNYENYNTEADLESAYGGLKKHGDVLEKLSDGYTMEELQGQGISKEKIQQFKEMLGTKNLTIDNAKAIYQYSIESNMILGVKRGTSKETIQEQIMTDFEEALRSRDVTETDIEKMKQFVQSLDYQYPLHNNYDIANEYMEQMGFKQNTRVSVRSAIQLIDRCTHIDEIITALEDGLGSTQISKPMKLYRAVKSSYLEKGLRDGETLNSLVGKSISNKGQTSTSPLYDSSFASLEEYDTVFEIYVPQGSRGAYIAELSAYDNTEQEVLLNPNDLYITGAQTGVTDKNGRTKNVLQALCLSKDRECYKGIEQYREQSKKQQHEQSTSSIDLPAKQNILSKFFNKIRARFLKGRNNMEQANPSSIKTQPKEKKTWELDSEEQKKQQKMQVEIGTDYRKKEEQKNQSTEEKQQNIELDEQEPYI